MNKILSVSRELVKGNFNALAKSTSVVENGTVIYPDRYRGSADFFIGSDGIERLFTYNGCQSGVTAYEKCPPFAAIINRTAQAYINGKTWVMNSQNKEAKGAIANNIRKLLKQPNPIQSWKQFEAQQQIYKKVFGCSILLPIIPFGYVGAEYATSMWNIPMNIVDIDATNKLFFQTDINQIIRSIVLKYKGIQTVLKADQLFFFKDITPSFNNMLFPESRAMALEFPINNIIGAYESENVIVNKRGALGILSFDPGTSQYAPVALDPDQKQELQDDFKRYGLKREQWQVIITSAQLKWQRMGMTPEELGLGETIKRNSMALCDGLNFPPHMLGLIDPTFNNQSAAEKGFYQNTIIPEANMDYEQWNNVFNAEENNLNLIKDYTELPIFQEDRVEQGRARLYMGQEVRAEFTAGMITMNRALELLEEDSVEGGDVYYADWIKLHPEYVLTTQTQNNGNQQGNAGQGNQAAQAN